MKEHLENLCEYRVVLCPFFKWGCQERMISMNLNDHLKEFELKHLFFKMDSMEGQINQFEQRNQQVERQMDELKQANQQLKSQVSELKQTNQQLNGQVQNNQQQIKINM